MANCSLCSVFNNDTEIDIGNECVCNAEIGAVLVTSDFQIYVRVTQSDPCAVEDWAFMGSATGFLMNISDEFGGSQSVGDGESMPFVGINGATVTVTAPNTVTINGRMFYSTGAPSGAPTDPSNVALHLNCTASTLYVWCPASSAWLGPIGGTGGGGNFNSFTITDGVNSQTINDTNSILFTSPNGSITITVSPIDTLSITVNAAQIPITDTGNYYIGGTIELALQEIGTKLHPAAILTNNAAPFAWNPTTQTANIPQVPSLTLPTPNQLSFVRGNGATQNISLVYVNSIVNNGDGTVTFNFSNGTTFVLDVCAILDANCGVFFLDANFLGIPTTVADGDPVTFVDTTQSSRPASGWQWSYSTDGSSYTLFSTLETPNFVFPAPGVYWIKLIFTNDQAAFDTEIKASYITVTGGGGGGDTVTFAFISPTFEDDYDDCAAVPAYLGGFASVTVPPPDPGPPPDTLGPNLLLNPGFESLGAGGADIWASWEEQNALVELDITTPHSGVNAVKLTRQTGSTPMVRQIVTVTPGEVYKLIAWTKCNGTIQGRYRIFDMINNLYIVNATNVGSNAVTWTQVSNDVTIPAGVTSIRVEFIGTGTDTIPVYYDDVEFRQVL